MKYDKDTLIDLCDRAIVPFNRWHDRDSPHSQVTVATIRAYLLAGCDFRISKKGTCKTNESTIWVEILHNEFEDDPSWHTYYMPTAKRLADARGGDWY